MVRTTSKAKKAKKVAAKSSGNNAGKDDVAEAGVGVANKKEEKSTKSGKGEKKSSGSKGSQSSHPVVDQETHAKYESVKRGELHITDLQKMTVSQLHELAKKEGFTDYVGLSKQEMVFKILKERPKSPL